MIYCVVPEVLADELYDKLVRYYQDDSNVEVIVERRTADRRGRMRISSQQQPASHLRTLRDRRRARITGEFPAIDAAPEE
jgi:hypothetical protein